MSTKPDPPKDLLAILQDDALIDGALQEAARQAIEEHRREGLPLAIWRDGAVAWVSAEELDTELSDSPPESTTGL